MSVLDCADPAALEAALEALPEGTFVLVVAQGQRHLLRRVPGGLHLRGDLAVACADVAEGRPTHVEVLGMDDRLPPGEEVERARRAFEVASALGDWEPAEALTSGLDDLASVGHADAAALRDEVQRWLDLYGEDPGDLPASGAQDPPW